MVYHFSKSRLFCNQKVDSSELVLLRNEVRTAVNNGSHYELNYPLRFLP